MNGNSRGGPKADISLSALRRLTDLRQGNQHQRHGYRTTDARGNLGKGHELHPIGRREDGDIACTALPAVAGGDDRSVDGYIFNQPPTKNPVVMIATTVETIVMR